MPVNIPDEQTHIARLVTDNFGARALDAAYVGKILISDDLYFRQVANEACGTSGVWLLVVLTFARNKGLIDRQRYAIAVAGLAMHRHTYVSLDGITLGDVFRYDKTAGLELFAATADYIGGKNCDIGSHLPVVENVIGQLWRSIGADELRRSKATSILLEKLIRFQREKWSTILASIFVRSPHSLKRYLSQWIRGHFLPFEEVNRAIGKFAEQLGKGRGK